ncbi:MAG: DUF2938 domain-containing protein [Proteobacteria bacterium]|nr:DUF2938 domain-containing protein [Pseudomonadota bacterium]
MTLDAALVVKAALVGIGGTVALDLWAVALKKVSGTPGTNWAMVGRWLGHMPHGRFMHDAIGTAEPVTHELLLGWAFHYAIGVAYGLLLIATAGTTWLQSPSPFEPVALALALLAAPYFVMMPGLGLGIAGSRTPRPQLTRLRSAAAHTVFGLGMYATALVLRGVAH